MSSNELTGPKDAIYLDDLIEKQRAEKEIIPINKKIKKLNYELGILKTDDERSYIKHRLKSLKKQQNKLSSIINYPMLFLPKLKYENERKQFLSGIDEILDEETLKIYSKLNSMSIDKYIKEVEFPIYLKEYVDFIKDKHYIYILQDVIRSIEYYIKNEKRYKALKEKKKKNGKYKTAIKTLHELDKYLGPDLIKSLEHIEHIVSSVLVTTHSEFEKFNKKSWISKLCSTGLDENDAKNFIKDTKFDIELN